MKKSIFDDQNTTGNPSVKQTEKQRVKRIVKACSIIVGVFVLCVLSFKLFEDANKSFNYVVQMPFTGEYHTWADGGLQWQGFGRVEVYSKTSQIEFTGVEANENGYLAVGDNPAAQATFNDNGRGMIIGSFRVVLPNDAQNMEKIQRDFGSERALINNLVKPTLYKVITACGPLMSSLESVSATRTDLISYITDQLNNGVYKTKSIKTEVVNELTGDKEIRTQAMIIENPDAIGGYERQEVSPFSMYGITCGLVSLTDIKYDRDTQNQIDAQRQANLAAITAKTKSLEAIQRTIQITEEGKATAEKAKWEQEKEKAVAVTKAEQEREVSKLAAEKAEFDKRRVIAEGEAEAAANRAKVAAGLTPQERAEWDYKTKVGVAEAFAKVNLPRIVTTGGSGSSNAMDAIGLKMLMEAADQVSK